MAELLEALAIDREKLSRRSVVVTGSNGKGSTAAFCAGIGQAFGLRTGLFTSPHLYRPNERFQIDGVSIGETDFNGLKSRIDAAIAEISGKRGERFGSFEAMFALACLYFQESRCGFAVFEAGIGGRYDPVRLVGAHETCVTSVDLEHVELLGNSLELIISDKSDACAASGRIIYGENCRGLRPHLAEYLRCRDITPLFVRDEITITGETVSTSDQRFDFVFDRYRFDALETGLSGAFQFNNAAVAIALFLSWLNRTQVEPSPPAIEAAIRKGLRKTRWPGRIEAIRQDPLTIIDVGHTPDAVRQAVASLKSIHGDQGWILVTGISRDKKTEEIVSVLAPTFDTIIATAAQHKGAPPEQIAEAARKFNPRATVLIASTIKEAVAASQQLAVTQKRKVYVAGGLFLAVEYAVAATGGRVEDLVFL